MGFKGDIIDITPDLANYGKWVERGNEILSWLILNEKHKISSYEEVDYDYVIIDDDNDMLYQQRHNFFQISPKTGLNFDISNNIINFLNSK